MKYSKDGYKRNSKDKNNPYNIIPSGDITMEGVDFPVYGIDNLGNEQIMMPGANYTFPGNTVFEVPLAQEGKEQPRIHPFEEWAASQGMDPQEALQMISANPEGYPPEVIEAAKSYAQELQRQNPINDKQDERLYEAKQEQSLYQPGGETNWLGNRTYSNEEIPIVGYNTYGDKNMIMQDWDVANRLREEGMDVDPNTISEIPNIGFQGLTKKLGVYENYYENPSALNWLGRNIVPALHNIWNISTDPIVKPIHALRGSPWIGPSLMDQAAGVEEKQVNEKGQRITRNQPDWVAWEDRGSLLNEDYEAEDLALDLAAFWNPLPDVIHGIEETAEGDPVSGAMYMLFGIVPGTAGPIVNKLRPKVGALMDILRTGKPYKENLKARELANDILDAAKNPDKKELNNLIKENQNTVNKHLMEVSDPALNPFSSFDGTITEPTILSPSAIANKFLKHNKYQDALTIARGGDNNVTLTRLQNSGGLTFKNGKVYIDKDPFIHTSHKTSTKTGKLPVDHKQLRNTTHFSSGAVLGHNAGDWGGKQVAIITNANTMKEVGQLQYLHPQDTWFYNKHALELPTEGSVILTRDKKLYNQILKESPNYNVKFIGDQIDEFAKLEKERIKNMSLQEITDMFGSNSHNHVNKGIVGKGEFYANSTRPDKNLSQWETDQFLERNSDYIIREDGMMISRYSSKNFSPWRIEGLKGIDNTAEGYAARGKTFDEWNTSFNDDFNGRNTRQIELFTQDGKITDEALEIYMASYREKIWNQMVNLDAGHALNIDKTLLKHPIHGPNFINNFEMSYDELMKTGAKTELELGKRWANYYNDVLTDSEKAKLLIGNEKPILKSDASQFSQHSVASHRNSPLGDGGIESLDVHPETGRAVKIIDGEYTPYNPFAWINERGVPTYNRGPWASRFERMPIEVQIHEVNKLKSVLDDDVFRQATSELENLHGMSWEELLQLPEYVNMKRGGGELSKYQDKGEVINLDEIQITDEAPHDFYYPDYNFYDISSQKADLLEKYNSPAFKDRYFKQYKNITGNDMTEEEWNQRITDQIEFTKQVPNMANPIDWGLPVNPLTQGYNFFDEDTEAYDLVGHTNPDVFKKFLTESRGHVQWNLNEDTGEYDFGNISLLGPREYQALERTYAPGGPDAFSYGYGADKGFHPYADIVKTHELSHLYNSPFSPLWKGVEEYNTPSNEIGFYADLFDQLDRGDTDFIREQVGHTSDLAEIGASKIMFEQALKDFNIWDPNEGEFTDKHYKKLLKHLDNPEFLSHPGTGAGGYIRMGTNDQGGMELQGEQNEGATYLDALGILDPKFIPKQWGGLGEPGYRNYSFLGAYDDETKEDYFSGDRSGLRHSQKILDWINRKHQLSPYLDSQRGRYGRRFNIKQQKNYNKNIDYFLSDKFTLDDVETGATRFGPDGYFTDEGNYQTISGITVPFTGRRKRILQNIGGKPFLPREAKYLSSIEDLKPVDLLGGNFSGLFISDNAEYFSDEYAHSRYNLQGRDSIFNKEIPGWELATDKEREKYKDKINSLFTKENHEMINSILSKHSRQYNYRWNDDYTSRGWKRQELTQEELDYLKNFEQQYVNLKEEITNDLYDYHEGRLNKTKQNVFKYLNEIAMDEGDGLIHADDGLEVGELPKPSNQIINYDQLEEPTDPNIVRYGTNAYRKAYYDNTLTTYNPEDGSLHFPMLDEIELTDDLPLTPKALRNWSRTHDPIAYASREATSEAAPYVLAMISPALVGASIPIATAIGTSAPATAGVGLLDDAAMGLYNSPYVGGAVRNAWNYNPTAISGGIGTSATIPGLTTGNLITSGFGAHGVTHIGPNSFNFLEDPSWSNAGAVGTNLLEMSPFFGYIPKLGSAITSSLPNINKRKILNYTYDKLRPLISLDMPGISHNPFTFRGTSKEAAKWMRDYYGHPLVQGSSRLSTHNAREVRKLNDMLAGEKYHFGTTGKTYDRSLNQRISSRLSYDDIMKGNYNLDDYAQVGKKGLYADDFFVANEASIADYNKRLETLNYYVDRFNKSIYPTADKMGDYKLYNNSYFNLFLDRMKLGLNRGYTKTKNNLKTTINWDQPNLYRRYKRVWDNTNPYKNFKESLAHQYNRYMRDWATSRGISYSGGPDSPRGWNPVTYTKGYGRSRQDQLGTKIHEGAHFWDDNASRMSNNQIMDLSRLNKKLPREGVSMRDLKDKWMYYQDPAEIQARFMQMRHHLNMKPGDKFTKEMLNEFDDMYGMRKYLNLDESPENMEMFLNTINKYNFQVGGGFDYTPQTQEQLKIHNVKDGEVNLEGLIPYRRENHTIPYDVDFHETEVPNYIKLRQSIAESTLDPTAVSDAGATGLTQIMPKTLQDYEEKTGDTDIDLLNYEDAMKVQNWYMNDLYNASFIANKPNQSEMVRMAKALVAYNWGRTNLYDHLTAQKAAGVNIYDDNMAWLYHESIPQESRNYLRKILWDTHPQMTIDYNHIMNNKDKYKTYLDAYDYKKKGGEEKRMGRLWSEYKKYNKGEKISSISLEELEKEGLIKSNQIQPNKYYSNQKDIQFSYIDDGGEIEFADQYILDDLNLAKVSRGAESPITLKQQVKFYEDHINSMYDGTKNFKKSKSLFDKINRLYLLDAKKDKKHVLTYMKSLPEFQDTGEVTDDLSAPVDNTNVVMPNPYDLYNADSSQNEVTEDGSTFESLLYPDQEVSTPENPIYHESYQPSYGALVYYVPDRQRDVNTGEYPEGSYFVEDLERMTPYLDEQYGEGNWKSIELPQTNYNPEWLELEDQIQRHEGTREYYNQLDNLQAEYNPLFDELYENPAFLRHYEDRLYTSQLDDYAGTPLITSEDAEGFYTQDQVDAHLLIQEKINDLVNKEKTARIDFNKTWNDELETAYPDLYNLKQKRLETNEKIPYTDLAESYFSDIKNLSSSGDIFLMQHGTGKVGPIMMSEHSRLKYQKKNPGQYLNTPGVVDTFSEILKAYLPEDNTVTCYGGMCNRDSDAFYITDESGVTTKFGRDTWSGYQDHFGETIEEKYFNAIDSGRADANWPSGGSYVTHYPTDEGVRSDTIGNLDYLNRGYPTLTGEWTGNDTRFTDQAEPPEPPPGGIGWEGEYRGTQRTIPRGQMMNNFRANRRVVEQLMRNPRRREDRREPNVSTGDDH